MLGFRYFSVKGLEKGMMGTLLLQVPLKLLEEGTMILLLWLWEVGLFHLKLSALNMVIEIIFLPLICLFVGNSYRESITGQLKDGLSQG